MTKPEILKQLQTKLPVSDVVSAPSPAPAATPIHPTGRSARIGLWALGVGFGGFLLWAG